MKTFAWIFFIGFLSSAGTASGAVKCEFILSTGEVWSETQGAVTTKHYPFPKTSIDKIMKVAEAPSLNNIAELMRAIVPGKLSSLFHIEVPSMDGGKLLFGFESANNRLKIITLDEKSEVGFMVNNLHNQNIHFLESELRQVKPNAFNLTIVMQVGSSIEKIINNLQMISHSLPPVYQALEVTFIRHSDGRLVPVFVRVGNSDFSPDLAINNSLGVSLPKEILSIYNENDIGDRAYGPHISTQN